MNDIGSIYVHNLQLKKKKHPDKKKSGGSFGKISTQPHMTLCIRFLDRENNHKSNTLPLEKKICLTIV